MDSMSTTPPCRNPGWSRCGVFHRREVDRRHVGPERASPLPVSGDDRWIGRPGFRSRRPADGSAAHSPKRPVDAGPYVPGRYRTGRIIDDEEASRYRSPQAVPVLGHRASHFRDELFDPDHVPQPDHPTIRQRQQAFGYTIEEPKMVITPWWWKGSPLMDRYAACGVVRTAAAVKFPSNSLRRSRTRRSIRSARNW